MQQYGADVCLIICDLLVSFEVKCWPTGKTILSRKVMGTFFSMRACTYAHIHVCICQPAGTSLFFGRKKTDYPLFCVFCVTHINLKPRASCFTQEMNCSDQYPHTKMCVLGSFHMHLCAELPSCFTRVHCIDTIDI